MPTAVKLSDEIVEIARSEANVMKRSIAGQVEYWATLGHAIEASGVMNFGRVRALLEGKGSVHALSAAEDALYLELLGNEIEALDGSDVEVIRELEAGQHPVAGEDEDGNLVVRSSDPSRHPVG